MADYIKRKDAQDAVMNTEPVYGMCKDGVASVAYQKTVDVIEAIDAIPSADVAPVRHGHWRLVSRLDEVERLYGAVIECSQCKHKVVAHYNYCPNCGAKMDEETK